MPLKISDILTLPPILNKWADKVDAKLAELEKVRVKHDKSIKHLDTVTAVVLPQNPTGVSITETGFLIDNTLKSQVSVTYTPPNPQGTFAGVFLVVSGYHGQAVPVKVGEDNYTSAGGSQTFNVTLDRTGETVTFYVVPKTQNEQTGLWTNGVVVSNVTLDGALGSQVRIGHIGAGGGNLCPNASFEFNQGGYNQGNAAYVIQSNAYLADNWYCSQNANNAFGAFIDTGTVHSGAKSLALTLINSVTYPVGTNYLIMVSDAIQCKPGDLIYLSGYLRTDQSVGLPANVTVIAGMQMRLFNSAGSEIAFPQVTLTSPTGSFSKYTPGPYLVPAGAVGFRVSCYIGINNSTGGNITINNGWWSAHFDDLTIHVQQASSSLVTAANGSYTPDKGTNASPLSNNGVASVINVAAFTNYYPWGPVSYNSGSTDPGVFGTFYVYCDDPQYQGGAITYQNTNIARVVTSGEGRLYIGKITTVSGGGGSSGGGGGGGACFSGDTRVQTILGNKRIAEITENDWLLTLNGWQKVKALIEHPGEDRDMLVMSEGQYVTPDHHMLKGKRWLPATHFFGKRIAYRGPVYNISMDTQREDERNFTLGNGLVAHNVLK